MTRREDRERMWREFRINQELHAEEVAFIRAHPIHTPEVGAQKAEQFIAHLAALTEWMERNYSRPGGSNRAEDPMPGRGEDTPAYYEVEHFFTPEQRDEVEHLHARGELVELKHKAQAYDELLQLLENLGLCEDAYLGPDNKLIPTLTVLDWEAASAWWTSTQSTFPDDEDDE